MSQARNFFLTPTTPRAKALAQQRSPTFAAKWGFYLNMDVASFQALFDKFRSADAS